MPNPFDYQPIPKLPKGRPPKPKTFTRKSDGKTVEVMRTRGEVEQRRKEVYERYEGRCANCGKFAPLHTVYDDETGTIKQFPGEGAHIQGRKAGGSDRDDSLENQEWKCHNCHGNQHRPKVVPKKARP